MGFQVLGTTLIDLFVRRPVSKQSQQPGLAFAGILHSGEASLGEAVDSLRNQTLDSTYVIIGGLKDREAHGRLYAELTSAQSCVFKAKLDADMVLASPRIFEAVQAVFGAAPRLEWLTLPLWDAISHRVIFGIHFWAPHVRWGRAVPLLHTDQVMSTARFRAVLKPVPYAAVHAPSHSPEELARYALRRLLLFLEYGDSTDAYWESVSAFISASLSESATYRSERAIIASATARLLLRLNPHDIMRVAEQPSSYLAVAESLAETTHEPMLDDEALAEAHRLIQDETFRGQTLVRYADLNLQIIRVEQRHRVRRLTFHLRNRGRIRSTQVDLDQLSGVYRSALGASTES